MIRLKEYIRRHLSMLALIFTMLMITLSLIRSKRWEDRIIDYDVIHYYGYLPSTFIYKDLTLKFTDNEKKFFANKIWYNTTPDGHRVFKVSMGMSVCYLPSFLVGHGYAVMTRQEVSGFSVPYKTALVLGSLLFSFLGLFYLRKLLLLWFSEITVSVSILLIVFGTNLFNYMVRDPLMSHLYSFALLTTLLYFIVRWHEKPSTKYSILIGLLTGWVFLIRPVNLLVVIIFLGWQINSRKDIRAKVQFFITNRKEIFWIIFAAFFMCLPQFLYWKIFSGNWLFYSYVGERFYFDHPRILEGLFSWRKGWLLYSPVMVLAIIGIFFLRRKIRQAVLIYPLSLAILLYITWSWWCWWYGGGYGQRSLIDWYGWMALAVSAVLESARQKKLPTAILYVFVFGCVAFNQFQFRQYQGQSLHYDSMTREAYFYRFWEINKHPGVDSLFQAPDYDKALKGEKEYYWN